MRQVYAKRDGREWQSATEVAVRSPELTSAGLLDIVGYYNDQSGWVVDTIDDLDSYDADFRKIVEQEIDGYYATIRFNDDFLHYLTEEEFASGVERFSDDVWQFEASDELSKF